MLAGATESQRKPGNGKSKLSSGGVQTGSKKDKGRQVASTSANILTHGKDAKLTQRVLEAVQRQPDSSKVLEPKSLGRKAVFRPILSSPFVVDWPSINAADLTAVFHTLLSFLQLDTIQQRLKRINKQVPRSSAAKTKEKNQRRRGRLLLATLHRYGITPVLAQPTSNKQRVQKDVSIHVDCEEAPVVLCGLNSVTRLLEAHISHRAHPGNEGEGGEESQDTSPHLPSIIFVCQADISPPTLVSHLPLLIATYNAMCKRSVTLIRLPAGSEALLSDAVQLRRCSVLSIDFAALQQWDDAAVSFGLKQLQQKLVDVHTQPMHMPWLENAVHTFSSQRHPAAPVATDLLPPRVKHMRSSAPVDMNALKAAKRAKRLQSGQKHKDRSRRLLILKGKRK